MHLRASEWINFPAFLGLALLAWNRRRLDRARRTKIIAIGVAAMTVTLFAALELPHLTSPRTSGITRDCIPVLMLTLFYWQAGQFVTRADVRFEEYLHGFDRKLAVPLLEWCARSRVGPWILTYLELAYLSYYALIPMSLATLYLVGAGRQADRFWFVVLLAAYGACSTLPFLQTRPPRALGEKWTIPIPSGKVRAFNLWILREGSIQANTCPSAHVAIATAAALVFLQVGPLPVGLLFLWIAVSIAGGAVAGRYHYAADAILGALTALAAFLIGLALAV